MEVRSNIGTRRFRRSKRAKSPARFRACRFRRRSTSLRSARKRRPRLISKTLKSAVANAENNANLQSRRSGGEGSDRGRRPDDEADDGARPRQRQPDFETEQPHPDRADGRDRDRNARDTEERRKKRRRRRSERAEGGEAARRKRKAKSVEEKRSNESKK